MFRAQAVLLASVCLAIAPAALAETHHDSHKAHAKGHAVETPAMKAKLRRAAEADEAPASPKAHAEKASSTGKHHHAADEAAEAAPAKSSKRHKGAAADEEADAAPSKSSRHHGQASHAGEAADAAPSKTKASRGHAKTAAAEEADATPSKASKRKHEEAEADQADAAPAKAHGRRRAAADAGDETPRSKIERAHAEEGEGSSLIRSELRSTKACVAAHVRLHGRPHGSHARLALQGECAKEVEAARRRAEEQIAIRNWSPPHGPLIYQGAMPHSTAAASEPPIGAPAISALPADPAAAPIGQTAQPDASAPTPASAPAAGSATVEQPPAPAPSNGLFGLFRRRPAFVRKPGEPAPTLAELVGSDETRLKAELGEPELMRAEGGGALWTYRLPDCALYVFLGRETSAGPWKVKGAQAGPLKRGGQTPEVDVCLKSGRS